MTNAEPDFFRLSQTKDEQILFVNTLLPPSRSIPLNCYTYNFYDDKYIFYRLFKHIYTQTKDGVSIEHSTFDFEEVSCKKHCIKSLVSMIDLNNGACEFLT